MHRRVMTKIGMTSREWHVSHGTEGTGIQMLGWRNAMQWLTGLSTQNIRFSMLPCYQCLHPAKYIVQSQGTFQGSSQCTGI